MSVCPKCGKEADGAKFCPECGAAIDAVQAEVEQAPAPAPVVPVQAPVQQDKPKKKKKGKVIGIIVAVILIFGLIGSCGSEDTESGTDSSSTTTTTETKKTTPSVDKSKLETEISEVEAIDGSQYTEDSYAALTAAIEAGKAVVANENATQTEVDNALDAINDANAALEAPFNPANYESVAYNDIARNPDSYIGKQVVFTGKVLQVMESSTEIDLRVATDGGYDDVVLAAYDPDLLDFRVLEDDQIKFYGMCLGLYTYTSTMGAEISIPAVYCEQVELQ